jgi:hypothetical protein
VVFRHAPFGRGRPKIEDFRDHERASLSRTTSTGWRERASSSRNQSGDPAARLVRATPVSPTGARWWAAPATRERVHLASNSGGRRPVLSARGTRSAALASIAGGWGGERPTDPTDESAVLAESKGERSRSGPDDVSTAGGARALRARRRGAQRGAAGREREGFVGISVVVPIVREREGYVGVPDVDRPGGHSIVTKDISSKT